MRDRTEQCLSETRLRAAWEHVFNSDREDGHLGRAVERFAADPDERIARLSEQLAQGTYLCRPLYSVEIPKGDGRTRELQIPSIEDRIVERALATELSPQIDSLLSPSSFAYRRGLGVADAVVRLAELRDEGRGWVVRADIQNCFPTIDRTRLKRMVSSLVVTPSVRDVIGALIDRPVRRHGRIVNARRGLPQGGSLSPVLSNAYLHAVDHRVWAAGFSIVRYSDDIAVATGSEQDARRALEVLERAVARGGQRLGKEKTRIVDFATAFTFLGEDFNAKYPTTSATRLRSEPVRKVLYVSMQGAGVFLKRGRVIVGQGDEELLSAPQSQVSRMVLAGSVGLSAGARSWALYNGTPVLFLSRRGNFLGSLEPDIDRDAELRAQQYRELGVEAFCLETARRIVAGKLSNQRTLLQRFTASKPKRHSIVVEAVEQIDFLRSQAGQGTDVATLMGVEGAAARSYWAAFGALLRTASSSRVGTVSHRQTSLTRRLVTATRSCKRSADRQSQRSVLIRRWASCTLLASLGPVCRSISWRSSGRWS